MGALTFPGENGRKGYPVFTRKCKQNKTKTTKAFPPFVSELRVVLAMEPPSRHLKSRPARDT